MKPSQITQIIIRLFALLWLVRGAGQIMAGIAVAGGQPWQPAMFFGGIIALALAAGAWFLAPTLGRLVTRGGDEYVGLGSITFAQLLRAVFIGVGLSLSLSSLGTLINSLHFFLVMKASPETIPEGLSLSPYDLSQSAVTFLAGVALIASASHWSRRLARE